MCLLFSASFLLPCTCSRDATNLLTQNSPDLPEKSGSLVVTPTLTSERKSNAEIGREALRKFCRNCGYVPSQNFPRKRDLLDYYAQKLSHASSSEIANPCENPYEIMMAILLPLDSITVIRPRSTAVPNKALGFMRRREVQIL